MTFRSILARLLWPKPTAVPQSEREARQTTPVALPSDVMVFIGELQVERGCADKKARRLVNRDAQISRGQK